MSKQRSSGSMPRTGPAYDGGTGGVPQGEGPGYGPVEPMPPVRPSGLPKLVERRTRAPQSKK